MASYPPPEFPVRANALTAWYSRKKWRIGRAGEPPHFPPAGTSVMTPGVGGNLNPLPEPKMRRDRGLAADRDEILERRRAGDADLRHDHAMACRW